MSSVFYGRYALFSDISGVPGCAWGPFHLLGDEARASPSFQSSGLPWVPVQGSQPDHPCCMGPSAWHSQCCGATEALHPACALAENTGVSQGNSGVGSTSTAPVPRSQWTGLLVSCPGGRGPLLTHVPGDAEGSVPGVSRVCVAEAAFLHTGRTSQPCCTGLSPLASSAGQRAGPLLSLPRRLAPLAWLTLMNAPQPPQLLPALRFGCLSLPLFHFVLRRPPCCGNTVPRMPPAGLAVTSWELFAARCRHFPWLAETNLEEPWRRLECRKLRHG